MDAKCFNGSAKSTDSHWSGKFVINAAGSEESTEFRH